MIWENAAFQTFNTHNFKTEPIEKIQKWLGGTEKINSSPVAKIKWWKFIPVNSFVYVFCLQVHVQVKDFFLQWKCVVWYLW